MPRPPGLTASLLASGVGLAWAALAAATYLAPLTEGTRLPVPAALALTLGAVAVTLAPWRGRRLLVRGEALGALATGLLPLAATLAAGLRLQWFQRVPPGAPASAAFDVALAAALLLPALGTLGLRLPALAGCVAGRPDAGALVTGWLAAHLLGLAVGAATGPALLQALGAGFASLAAAAMLAAASLTATRAAADPPPPEATGNPGAPGALLAATAAWAGLLAEPLRRLALLDAAPALATLAIAFALVTRLSPAGSTWRQALVSRAALAALTLAAAPHVPWPAPLLALGLAPLLAGLLGQLALDERALTRGLLLAGAAGTAGAALGPAFALPSLGLAGVIATATLSLGLGALYLAIRVRTTPTATRLLAGLAVAGALLAATTELRVPRGVPHFDLYTDQPEESLAVTRKGLVTTLHVDGAPWLRGPRSPAETALGHLPWLLRSGGDEDASALVLSLGTGAAPEAIALHGVSTLTIGAATPGRVAVTEEYFGTRYRAPFDPERASLQVLGPRTLLTAWPEQVSVIHAREAAGVRVTAEFAAAAARRLRPGGLLAIALAPEQLRPAHLRGAVRALMSSFQHLELHGYPEPILLASTEELPRRPYPIHEALQRPGVFASLERAGLPRHPARILARRLATTQVLRHWAGPGTAPSDVQAAAPRGVPPTPESLVELYTTLATHPYAEQVVTREDLMQKSGDGGVVLTTARIHLNRDLAALTHDVMLRKAPIHPLEPRAEPAALAAALTEWRGRIPDGSIWLRSWPQELLPDPHARHQMEQARVHGTALLSGHEMHWAVYPLEDGARYRSMATWSCPIQNRSHVLRVDFPARTASKRLVLETIEGVACLHPGEPGELRWDHKIRPAPRPGA